MKRNIYVVVAVVTQIIALCECIQAQSGGSMVKFRSGPNSMIIVPVAINDGETLEFLLDTGATTTTLTTETARRLMLQPIDSTEVDTPTGPVAVSRGSVSKLTMGKRSASETKVYWTDMPMLKQVDPKLSGVLGLNFLRQFNFAIDLETKRITIDPASAEGARVPMQFAGGRLLLRSDLDGTILSLALDSGAMGLVLYASGCQKVGDQIKSTGTVRVFTAVGISAPDSGAVNRLSIGDIRFDAISVSLMRGIERPADGLLPLNLFRSVYFNTAEGYVVAKPRTP